MGTMSREVDGLRTANAQIQARLTETLMQQSSGVQVQDCMQVLSQMAQEVKIIKHALQTEKEENSSACSKLWDVVKAETQKRTDIQEDQERLRSLLNVSLDEQTLALQEVHE